ncbi:MAG: hypothetical protein OES38_16830 [Gammaproteobacteria bacterium]|nr:hypothetical protein [Gammaproteobacteria bacterium]
MAPETLTIVLANLLEAPVHYRQALTVAGHMPECLALYRDSEDIAAVENVDVCACFRKRLEVGWNEPASEGPAPAILATLTGPANGAPVQELNAWYDAHVIDIVSTPGIVRGARYDRAEVKQGAAAPYFAFYELDTDDVEQVAADLAEVMATCPSGGIPVNTDGQPWLVIDGFAYFTLSSASTD